MLLRHSALYSVARGAPAIVNFLALALYSRLLYPEAYGRYALVVAAVGLTNAVLFQWLMLGLQRFRPAYDARKDVFLSSIVAGYLGVVLLTGALGFMAYGFGGPELGWLLPLSLLLLWVQAWFELNLELRRSELAPRRYGSLAISKAVLAVALGGLLAYLGFGATGLIAGLIVGMAVPSLTLGTGEWLSVRARSVDTRVLKQLFEYGLPLTAAQALTVLIGNTDRLMLGWLRGEEAAGLYAVGYDLPQHSLGVLMGIVNIAALPLAIRALEDRGVLGARQQLCQNGWLLVLISVPATVGLAVLAPNIATVILGAEYREIAARLIPWVALAGLLSGFRAFYFDLAFQLGKRTIDQMWVRLVAAGANVLLNLWWIPRMGLLGAAYASVAAFAIGLGVSWWTGRRVFPLPLLPADSFKATLAAAGMGIALWPTHSFRGPSLLVGQIVGGVGVYAVLLLLLNARGVRARAARLVRAGVRTIGLASGEKDAGHP